MPSNSDPLTVQAIVSFDEKTVTDMAARNKESTAIQKSIKKATWAALGAVAIYAVVTMFMWCAMLRQNKLSERAIHQTKIQWAAQNRPWVAVSNAMQLPKKLVFLAFAGPKPFTGVELKTSLNLKNVGISPSFKVGSAIELLLADSALKLPQSEMTSACSLADQAGLGESVIFPNTEITQGFEMQQNQAIAFQKVQRLWAIGCISYLDQTSESTRHTKFWVVSQMLQDNVKPSFIKRENRGGRTVDSYSLPVSGWLLLKTEAD